MRLTTTIRAASIAAYAIAMFAAPAAAQTDPAAGYPNKPIHFVLGFAAGGGTDLLARIVGPKLAEILGQAVIIENAIPEIETEANRIVKQPIQSAALVLDLVSS